MRHTIKQYIYSDRLKANVYPNVDAPPSNGDVRQNNVLSCDAKFAGSSISYAGPGFTSIARSPYLTRSPPISLSLFACLYPFAGSGRRSHERYMNCLKPDTILHSVNTFLKTQTTHAGCSCTTLLYHGGLKISDCSLTYSTCCSNC